jgi:hypothetical protein
MKIKLKSFFDFPFRQFDNIVVNFETKYKILRLKFTYTFYPKANQGCTRDVHPRRRGSPVCQDFLKEKAFCH